MSRLRIVYILSLVLLGILVVFTVFRPMATGREYSEVQRDGLLETEDGQIIQFDILNYEGKDIKYTINVLVDGEPSTLTVAIPDKEAFTYIKHIKRDMLGDGVVSFSVYKEGEDSPLDEATYYLK